MKTLVIDEKYNKKKLNNVLQSEFPDLSINTIYKALRKKDIKINGEREERLPGNANIAFKGVERRNTFTKT